MRHTKIFHERNCEPGDMLSEDHHLYGPGIEF